uniref:Serine protease K12H4.7 n=1 Tax=Syphacia muris TaxID=451379 RepID=A0A158R4A1_9BILA
MLSKNIIVAMQNRLVKQHNEISSSYKVDLVCLDCCGIDATKKTLQDADANTIEAKIFQQTLDHFNSDVTTKWNQKYYVNKKYYVSGSPVFLIIGGESFDLGKWTVGSDLQYVRYAKNNTALIFALEHRFYGDSRPFENQNVENLKYLSSRQAVEDAADFIRAMNGEYNLADAKWIVFGASYGGFLADAIYRKHPELVKGAILSSAFAKTELDFQKYLYDIGRALYLEYYRYDFDDECSKALFDVFKLMSASMYSEEGRRTLTDTFLVEPRLDRNKTLKYAEMQMFFASIIASLEGIVQYNNLNVRYWHNTQYYVEGGPHFLFLAGESTANEYWVTEEVQIMRSARAYNASVYMLEHRYYGFSWPTEDQLTSNLKEFLNAEEALADIAYFIETMNKQNNYTNPKWITFGGSYAGVLSAWFREYYPHLTVGAIATSAPVEIKADFYEYVMVVERSIKSSSQGDNCYTVMKKGVEQIFQKTQSAKGRVELSNIFKLNPSWNESSNPSELDIQYFIQNFFGYFEGAIQYNNNNRNKYAVPGGSIEDFCRVINNSAEQEEYKRVAEAMKAVAVHFDGQFSSLPNKYEDMVTELKRTDSWDGISSRTWLFQTCYQFGYFQSSDIGDNIIGSSRPVNFFINLCNDVFEDWSYAHYIYSSVQKTQRMYLGSENYNGTNVVFINGKIDPWSALGEYNERDSIEIRLLNSTAHCADMYVPRDSDPQELKDARLVIDNAIGKWLGIITTPAPSTTARTSSVTVPTTTSPNVNSTTTQTPTTSAASKFIQ